MSNAGDKNKQRRDKEKEKKEREKRENAAAETAVGQGPSPARADTRDTGRDSPSTASLAVRTVQPAVPVQSSSGVHSGGGTPRDSPQAGGVRQNPKSSHFHQSSDVSTAAAGQKKAAPPDEEEDEEKAARRLQYADVSVLPDRKGICSKGEACKVSTNYFAINVSGKPVLYVYNVEIRERPAEGSTRQHDKEPSRRAKRRIFEILLPTLPNLPKATNYSTLVVTLGQISGSLTHAIKYLEEGEPGPRNPELYYDVTLTLSKTLHGRFPEVSTRARREQCVGASRFFRVTNNVNPQNFDLGGGLLVFSGYFRSVRCTTNRLMLNVNVASSAFYRDGNLTELIHEWSCAYHGLRGGQQVNLPVLQQGDLHALDRFLKGLRVMTHYLGRPVGRTICGLASTDSNPVPKHVTFKIKEDGKPEKVKSVSQYFKDKYNINLIDRPATHLVVNVRTDKNPMYLPCEVCTVLPGQPYRGLLENNQTEKMLTKACRIPQENKNLINGGGRMLFNLKPQYGGGELPGSFNLSFQPEMLEIPARFLPAPALWYTNRTSITVNNGAWDLRDVGVETKGGSTFSDPRGGKWTIIQLRDRFGVPEQALDGLSWNLDAQMTRYGIDAEYVDPPQPRSFQPPHDPKQKRNQISKILEACKKAGTELVFVVVPDKNKSNYSFIKYAGDVELGIRTICIVRKGRELLKDDASFMTNLLFKFNLKFGGTNHHLKPANLAPLFDANSVCDTMVMGLDVTHPGPGSMDQAPSIAAVVASIDARFNQYPASVRAQGSRREMIEALTLMIKERLNRWEQANGGKSPRKIIVYRDGVSEGQFALVLRKEWPQFAEAFRQKWGDQREKWPKVTMLSVQKRHNTRFYECPRTSKSKVVQSSSKPGTERARNLAPGLIVDQDITFERGFDWFCQSHAAIIGTARPAQYVVLKNELALDATQLQELTYNMCFLYGRCSRSVSIHPAAYFADIACEKARLFLYHVYRPPPGRKQDYLTARTQGSFRDWSAGVKEPNASSMWYV